MQNYFKSNLLSQVSFIDHAFFGRQGGVSTGVFSSLNASFKVKDDKENVKKNRSIIANHFNLTDNNLFTLNQVHSTKIINLNSLNNTQDVSITEADGLITNQPNLILGIYTADCLPILFVDTKSKNIAAIHCGWKGLLNGIIENTITNLKTLSKENNILMVIGPCIHQESYEVDFNFYENFINKDNSAESFFKKLSTEKKYSFNLPLYAYNIGVKNGLNKSNIDIINLDTYKNEDLFFSHRRSSKKGEDRGLQLSCIVLKPKE